MALKPGSPLGPYEVRSQLGSGAMGEVYRAHDPRLDREVAVKVLHDGVGDRERLARFEQEARAVSALSHPSILAVYDVGAQGGVPYVVSELLEGQTLRVRLDGGALPAGKAVDYALQIAGGLAAAHGKGIVHRDLKPDNVFVTVDGRAKILDFGLAKLTFPVPLLLGATGHASSDPTEPGVVLGTVGYMSPEQVRGERVDHRTDIFSFGALLYEMLCGRRAFRRPSAVETMNAILTEDPMDLRVVSREASPALEPVVRRCLEKRREDRFHSAHDLALALEACSAVSASRRAPMIVRRRWAWAAAIVATVAIAGALMRSPTTTSRPLLRVRPITSDPGPEYEPALSPDGNQVAYVKARDGRQALYVKLIDGGEPLLVSEGATDTSAPVWSPDGRQIAFTRLVADEAGEVASGVFVVPALGGPARQLTTIQGRIWDGLSWSPDKKSLAMADRESLEGPTAIVLLSLESGQRRRLTHPPDGYRGDSLPRFSPDGRTVAFVRSVAAFQTDVYLVPFGGGKEQRLTVGNLETAALDWVDDGRSLVFSSWRAGGAGVISLWRVAVSGGDPEPLEFGERGYWPTISRRGGRLAYVQQDMSLDIWRVDGPTAPEGERSPTRLISSTRMDYHARYSPDGTQIVFASLRSGAGEIWICDSDGSNQQQITFLDDSLSLSPKWSPDGRQIAFTAAKDGTWNVYAMSASGGLPRRLTSGLHDLTQSWSRDGLFVYFHSNRSGRFELWKVSPSGGEAVQVTTQGGTNGSESPDGRHVYYGKALLGEERPGIWRIPRDGGEEVQVLDRAGSAWWTPLDRSILHVNRRSSPPTLELVELGGGEVSWVAPLDVPVAAPIISASPDLRWVLYTGAERMEADIMLAEGFR